MGWRRGWPLDRTRGSGVARWIGLGALAGVAALLVVTRFEITGGAYGLFLVREGRARLEIKDDLLFGQGERLVTGLSFARVRAIARADDRLDEAGAYLENEWDPAIGRGLVRNHLADGTELVTLLSRFDNGGQDGGARRGVFVGGALPDVAMGIGGPAQNESGIAYRDRAGRWMHVWCNSNEAVWDVARAREIDTWEYAFRGSRVVSNDPRHLVLESSHQLEIAGAPVRMRRVARFTAGEPWLELEVTLQNVGAFPVEYLFLYGDEPWVGNYGSADGNLGWTDEGTITVESLVDARRLRGAGIMDVKTGIANFLAWPIENPPDVVYVSNAMGTLSPGVPLSSNEIFIGTEWRGRVLRPGEAQQYRLVIGMATRDPVTSLPRVPDGAIRPRT